MSVAVPRETLIVAPCGNGLVKVGFAGQSVMFCTGVEGIPSGTPMSARSDCVVVDVEAELIVVVVDVEVLGGEDDAVPPATNIGSNTKQANPAASGRPIKRPRRVLIPIP